MAKTQPGSAAATITPETAGPTTCTELRESASSALACWSRPAEIVCGTRPVAAGRKNALAAPNGNDVTASIQISAAPLSSATATNA